MNRVVSLENVVEPANSGVGGKGFAPAFLAGNGFTVPRTLSDDELAEEISRRRVMESKWNTIYWEEFIPFAHGVRIFGQFTVIRYDPTTRADSSDSSVQPRWRGSRETGFLRRWPPWSAPTGNSRNK